MMKVAVTDRLARLKPGGRTTGPPVLDLGFTHLTLKAAEGLDRRVAPRHLHSWGTRKKQRQQVSGEVVKLLESWVGFRAQSPLDPMCIPPPHLLPLFLLLSSSSSSPSFSFCLFLQEAFPIFPVRKQSPLSLVGFPWA